MSTAYRVSGAVAVLRTDKGNERYVYRGGVIESTPDTEESIKHLLSVGLIEEATDVPTSAASPSEAGPYAGVSNAELKAAVKQRNDDGRDDDAKLAPASQKNVDLIAALVADDEKQAAASSGSGE